MISVFLREQKRYTQEDLVKEFHCSEEKTVRILKRLKEYGVLKAVKAKAAPSNLYELIEEITEQCLHRQCSVIFIICLHIR